MIDESLVERDKKKEHRRTERDQDERQGDKDAEQGQGWTVIDEVRACEDGQLRKDDGDGMGTT